MEVYLFLMLFVIPFFWYGAANGSHDFLAILFSAVVWAYWLFTGVPYHPLLFGIILWLIMSVAWSTHEGNSINDLIILITLPTVIFAAQSVDKFLIMLFSFIPAAGMAGLEIYQWWNKHGPARRGAMFGNTNHSGVYYAINFFIGLWMGYNISLIFLPFCVLILIGLFLTRCRAAILSLCIGMGVMLFKEAGNWVTLFICVLIGLLTITTQYANPSVGEKDYGLHTTRDAFRGRWDIFKKAIGMIIERPVWGWGLGTFRKEHQGRLPAMPTHRVHNDILEIAFEVGLVGLLLIGYFFYTLSWSDPFLSAALIAGIVSSCSFFTFRESHTAAPLMAICGLSLPPIETVAVPYIISGITVLAMLYILWVHVIRKIVALSWYSNGSHQTEKKKQAYCVKKAIEWCPSTEYLARYSYLVNEFDRCQSFDIAAEMVYKYDGRVVLWEALDQLARASYRMGAVNLAGYFNYKSLQTNPSFKKGLEFKEGIEKLFKDLEESKNGTMAVR